MRELLIATSNKGKLPELLAALGDVPFTILTLADVDKGTDVAEPGNTFEGNAIIKAMTYGKRSGKLTLAEDTGLEVDALGGRPGVLTARYAEGDDTARNEKLLRELTDVPDNMRGARFRTVAALYDPVTDKVALTEGECRGSIIREYRGNKSFGYGPLFLVEGLTQTFSELEMDERNAVSHRGKAIKKMRDLLLGEFL